MPITYSDIASDSRALVDFDTDPFISDTVLARWINQGVESLWTIIETIYPESVANGVTFTLTNTSNVTTIPANTRRVLWVEKDPATTAHHKIPHVDPVDDNNLYATHAWYIASGLYIVPELQCAGTYRMTYISGPTLTTSALANTPEDIMQPHTEYISLFAAIKMAGRDREVRNDLVERLAVKKQEIERILERTRHSRQGTGIVDVRNTRNWPPYLGRP